MKIDMSRYELIPGTENEYRIKANREQRTNANKSSTDKRHPNKTETRAMAIMQRLIPNITWQSHVESWRLSNGHVYTPDIVAVREKIAIEVKGSYAHQSRQRSRVMFDLARVDKSDWTFIWMSEKHSKIKGKYWSMELYNDKG